MASEGGIVINHLMNGKVTLSDTLSVSVETSYPYGERATVKVNTGAPVKFDIAIRVPEYAKGKMTVNGECATPDDLGYVTLSREWADGDTVDLVIPRELTVTELNGKIAVTNGIIVYALDERIQNLDVKLSGKIISAEKITPDFAHREAMRITFENGASADFVDYASAGWDWGNKKNRLTIWINK